MKFFFVLIFFSFSKPATNKTDFYYILFLHISMPTQIDRKKNFKRLYNLKISRKSTAHFLFKAF